MISLVALNLLSTPPSTFDQEALVWVPDGRPRLFRLDGEEFSVRLSNEGSKFNLNEITREQLIALVDAVQAEEDRDELLSEQVADAVVDWARRERPFHVKRC